MAESDDEDGPLLPLTIGADDSTGIQCRGLFDAGDGRVLIWFGSDPDGGDVITRNADGQVVPFIVVWQWDEVDAKGSPGGGWEYQTAKAARTRFVREIAQASV